MAYRLNSPTHSHTDQPSAPAQLLQGVDGGKAASHGNPQAQVALAKAQGVVQHDQVGVVVRQLAEHVKADNAQARWKQTSSLGSCTRGQMRQLPACCLVCLHCAPGAAWTGSDCMRQGVVPEGWWQCIAAG